MAEVVKMCDLPAAIAAEVFAKLNTGKIQVGEDKILGIFIRTEVEPKDLIYPEGWYYAEGSFRNKHQSTTGLYSEITMFKENGDFWEEFAHYTTIK